VAPLSVRGVRGSWASALSESALKARILNLASLTNKVAQYESESDWKQAGVEHCVKVSLARARGSRGRMPVARRGVRRN
jgi:hypothetical protein